MQLPIVFDPIYSQLHLAKRHRFPIEKYQRLFDAANRFYPAQLNHVSVPGFIDKSILNQVHQASYIEQFMCGTLPIKAMKRIGFEWSQQFVDRTLTAVNGTLTTAKLAAKYGVAINCTGGYHHAHPDFGSGFCVFNDLVIAANDLLSNQLATRILIFDCDVHQGDGSAICARDLDNVFTVSIHCEKNFPSRKQQSDWDVGVDKHLEDEEYNRIVKETFDASIQSIKPDFIIYDAGVDIHIDDDLGLLDITTEGVRTRDTYIFEQAKKLGIPIMAVIGGGYQRDIDALTQVHLQLIHSAVATFC